MRQPIKNTWLVCLFLLCIPLTACPQTKDFTGYTIFINPGHGGYESNDRHIPQTGFWESEGNLIKGLYLKDLLESLHATVYLSRTTNDLSGDLALSVISEMANATDADFFLSIHSNGFDGTQNWPLMLFRGYDDQPVFAEAKNMAGIIWRNIMAKSNGWTSSTRDVKGDWSFYPDWGNQVGLGVLRTLTMPGVLSEGSFHDYIPESWRLRNTDYLHHEARAFLRSFMELKGIAPGNHGIIAGTVRDSCQTPLWYFKPGTPDEKLPLNGVSVTLMPGNKIYRTDSLNNGYFFFDSLAPGNYTLGFDGLMDYFKDSLSVTVMANQTSIADIWLKNDTTRVPELVSISPYLTDSIPLDQAFTVTFSLPMDSSSVQKAIRFSPAQFLNYTWDDEHRKVTVRPDTLLKPNTTYTINITTRANSRWNVGISSGMQYNFVTIHRTNLAIKKAYPTDSLSDVSLYPQIRIYFDAPVLESSAASEIRLVNDQGRIVTRLRERFIESSGGGAYFFETSRPLELNQEYKVILGAGLTDKTGVTLGSDVEILFKTRATSYCTGDIIEPYETAAHFWDPENSGSTVGTDNSLTTFTASSEVSHSGSCSGQLNYTFTGTGGLCRVFDTQKPIIGNNPYSSFGIWVFGDLSYNRLEYWFYSSGSVNQQVYADVIDWAGWEFKTIPFAAIGATGEILFHSMVVRQTDNGSASGTLWFDDATVCTTSGTTDIVVENTVSFGPNPLSGTGMIKISLKGRSTVTADVYNIHGEKIKSICKAQLNSGNWDIPWIPAKTLANGIYLIRVEITPTGGSASRFSERCVLSR